MARKRMIDPNIWESEDFGEMSTLSKLLFIGMFSIADDEGRGRANSRYLINTLFKFSDDVGLHDIEDSLAEIKDRMSILFYEADGKKYYQLLHWREWQTIQKPVPSKIPTPTVPVQYNYSTPTVGLQDEYSLIEKNRKEENIKEHNRSFIDHKEEREKEEKKSTKRKEDKERVCGDSDSGNDNDDDNDTNTHIPHSLDRVLEYASSIGITTRTTAESFFDHFSSNGWKVSGKTPMKDWKAAFRNWVRNEKKYAVHSRNYSEHKNQNLDHLLVNLDEE